MAVTDDINNLIGQISTALSTLTDQLVNDTCSVRDITEINAKIVALNGLLAELNPEEPVEQKCCPPIFSNGSPNDNNVVGEDGRWYIDTQENLAYLWDSVNNVWELKHNFNTNTPSFSETDTSHSYLWDDNTLRLTYQSETGVKNYEVDFSEYVNFNERVETFGIVDGNIVFHFKSKEEVQEFSIPLPTVELPIETKPQVVEFTPIGNDLSFKFDPGDGVLQTFSVPLQTFAEYVTSLYRFSFDVNTSVLSIGYKKEGDIDEEYSVDLTSIKSKSDITGFVFDPNTNKLTLTYITPSGVEKTFEQNLSDFRETLTQISNFSLDVENKKILITYDWEDEGVQELEIDATLLINGIVDLLEPTISGTTVTFPFTKVENGAIVNDSYQIDIQDLIEVQVVDSNNSTRKKEIASVNQEEIYESVSHFVEELGVVVTINGETGISLEFQTEEEIQTVNLPIAEAVKKMFEEKEIEFCGIKSIELVSGGVSVSNFNVFENEEYSFENNNSCLLKITSCNDDISFINLTSCSGSSGGNGGTGIDYAVTVQNDGGYKQVSQLGGILFTLHPVATSGDFNDLDNIPPMVLSVNNIGPDSNGNVSITIADLDGLSETEINNLINQMRSDLEIQIQQKENYIGTPTAPSIKVYNPDGTVEYQQFTINNIQGNFT